MVNAVPRDLHHRASLAVDLEALIGIPVISTARPISTVLNWSLILTRDLRALQDFEVFWPHAHNLTAAAFNFDGDESACRHLRHHATFAADVEACILHAHQLDSLADLQRTIHRPRGSLRPRERDAARVA